jgi:hypothetical protein
MFRIVLISLLAIQASCPAPALCTPADLPSIGLQQIFDPAVKQIKQLVDNSSKLLAMNHASSHSPALMTASNPHVKPIQPPPPPAAPPVSHFIKQNESPEISSLLKSKTHGKPVDLRATGKEPSFRPAAAMAAGVVAAPPSIIEMARALKKNLDLIYQHVMNNVDYYPTFGFQKGALGALIDGQANDADQTQLMVALLRQSGISADYVFGSITLTPSQVSNLFGINAMGSAGSQTLYDLLTNNNMPFVSITGNPDGSVSSVELYWGGPRSSGHRIRCLSLPPLLLLFSSQWCHVRYRLSMQQRLNLFQGHLLVCKQRLPGVCDNLRPGAVFPGCRT